MSEDPTRGRPDFDELARDLVNGHISRRRALKLFAASALASLVPARFAIGEEKKKKITICHKPGTPAEKTKQVPESALEGHLGHGDTLGPCEKKTTTTTRAPTTTTTTTAAPTTTTTTTAAPTTTTTTTAAPTTTTTTTAAPTTTTTTTRRPPPTTPGPPKP